MPVSEDEFERPTQMAANQTAMSKAEQRKSNKPIMEKRRRARINHCLNELKTLILDAMKKDPARHSKLEKADILEMTVKHLQQIQRQQLTTAVAADPTVIMRFKSGFDECAAEVSRFISRLEGVDSGVKQRLTAHLHRCVSSLQQISPFPQQTVFSALTQNCDKSPIVLPNVPSIPGDVNNNSNQNGERIQIPSGLHLIPSRLPTGELALLVPNSNHISTFLNAPTGATLQFPANVNVNAVLSPTLGGTLASPKHANHASAFTAVGKNQEYPSPTSTADVVKKEPEREEFKTPSYLNGLLEPSSYHQSYNFKVTNSRDAEEEHDYRNSNSLPSTEPTAIHGKFEQDRKVCQRPTSTSFQKNAADSTTTTLLPVKEEEATGTGTGFKPFQIDLPNSHLKAHVTIPRSETDLEPSAPHQIHHKPNPKFTINPNRLYQKSSHKFVRTHPENNFGPEAGKFENVSGPIESTSGPIKTAEMDDSNVDSEPTRSPPPSKPSSSSSSFPQTDESIANKSIENSYVRKMAKRPLSQPEVTPSQSSSAKIPRLSSPVEDGDTVENRCKRISVIVEDSSKTNGKENNRKVTTTTNVSSQKDMWRPW